MKMNFLRADILLTSLLFLAGFFPNDAVTGESEVIKNVIVYYEPGRFGGWPANSGAWNWGDEILVGFGKGYFEDKKDNHSINKNKPIHSALGRSLDGGETWTTEERDDLNGEGAMPCPGGINFAHPDFAMVVNRVYFQVSYDRGHNWSAPYKLPDLGMGLQLTSRTDYLVEDRDTCLVFLSSREKMVRTEESLQDRAFCIRLQDGGKNAEFLSWMTGEPLTVRSVMPSTVRVSETELVSVLRRRIDLNTEFRNDVNWVDAYGSSDNGRFWKFLSRVAYTDTTLHNGNPPSMVRLPNGRLAVTYGYRGVPYGIRARLSDDNGKSWGREIILRDDGRKYDLGYPRSVVRKDGKIVTIYYFGSEKNYEQHIAATIWNPAQF